MAQPFPPIEIPTPRISAPHNKGSGKAITKAGEEVTPVSGISFDPENTEPTSPDPEDKDIMKIGSG